VVALVAFLGREQRAQEPIFPPRLLNNRVFTSTGIVGLLLGFAMFGTITFLPLYFQVVRGASPTKSGLEILPLMAGLILTSTVGGQIVSRTGRYRIFPIVGTAFMTVGGFLLAQLTPQTSMITAAVFMFIAGFGIGLVMQVLVVAVQNAVGYEDLGVATSGSTLLRNTGSSIGTAIVGTIFATQLASRLKSALPHSSGVALNTSHPTTAELARLSPGVRHTVLAAYSSSLDRAFLVGAFISIVAFIASWFITELPMRTTIQSVAAEGEPSEHAGRAPATVDALVGAPEARGVAAGRLTPTVASGSPDERSGSLPIVELSEDGWVTPDPVETAAIPASPKVEVR
jgi:hypothetical protein